MVGGRIGGFSKPWITETAYLEELTRPGGPRLAVHCAPALRPAVGLDLGRCEVPFHVRRIDLESAVMQSQLVPSSLADTGRSASSRGRSVLPRMRA